MAARNELAEWAVVRLTDLVVGQWEAGEVSPVEIQTLIDMLGHRRQAEIAQSVANGLTRALGEYVSRTGICSRCLCEGGCVCGCNDKAADLDIAIGGTCCEEDAV